MIIITNYGGAEQGYNPYHATYIDYIMQHI
jgi:hypothetical protein